MPKYPGGGAAGPPLSAARSAANRIGGGKAGSGGPMASSSSSGGGQKVAGLYDLEETLGEGHYAVVKSARHVFTGERVAVKVIDKMKLDAATRLQMLQEVRLMKLVQHPHVVRLYEVIDTQTKLYLILELADGGDMYDYIMKHEGRGLQEDAARKYFRQIVHAIQYCHQLHVVHRDLKPENVVFFEKLGMVKLTDFGFSNKFDPGQQLQTSCGSLAYSAPEILLGDAYDAPAVDVWSLGVILYMLVCGSAPFQEANDSETLTMIMDCKYSFPSHISSQCRSLISRMLQREPESRASLEDILTDAWLEIPAAAAPGGDAAAAAAADSSFMLPLVSRQHLKDEDHANILQKMVAGAIASKDEIIEALDRNEYNHITATYFLLAERKLRAQRMDQANRSRLRQHQAMKSEHHHHRKDHRVLQQQQHGHRPNLDNSSSTLITRGNVANPASSLAAAATTKDVSTVKRSSEATSSIDPVVRPPADVTGWLSPRNDNSERGFSTNDASASGGGNGSGPSVGSGSGSKFQPSSSSAAAIKFRVRKCSIVEEDEEEEEEEELDGEDEADDVTGLKRNKPLSASSKQLSLSSNSIPLDAITEVTSSSPSSLHPPEETPPPPKSETPTPFPVSSQIGSGNLSRQNSLRRGERGGGGGESCTSSERGSPSSPPGSNASSSHSSPARYKIALPNRKLVSTRSSPQLMPSSAPVLKEIHEEVEEGGGSGSGGGAGSSSSATSSAAVAMDPVDAFPSSRAGAVVIRRLEHRRRIRLHKSRTQSCSSSDASDDDACLSSESRKKRNNQQQTSTAEASSHFLMSRKRGENNDDSSDNRDSGVGRGTAAGGGSADIRGASSGGGGAETTETSGGKGGNGGGGGSQRAKLPVAGVIAEEKEEDLISIESPKASRGASQGVAVTPPKRVTAAAPERAAAPVRKMSGDSTDSSEWEDEADRYGKRISAAATADSVEKNTGLQILKRRLHKLRQETLQQQQSEVTSTDANLGKSEAEKSGNSNKLQSSSSLHRAHSCSSLFSLQQNLVRHRRLSCQSGGGGGIGGLHPPPPPPASAVIFDLFGVPDKNRPPLKSLDLHCKKNSFIQFLNPAGCFDVC